jgi:uncharacterized membrane protein YciS (DUF1049 family)
MKYLFAFAVVVLAVVMAVTFGSAPGFVVQAKPIDATAFATYSTPE